jgi:hypothetical protein
MLSHFYFFRSVLAECISEAAVNHVNSFGGDVARLCRVLALVKVEACDHAFEHEEVRREMIVPWHVDDFFGLLQRGLL